MSSPGLQVFSAGSIIGRTLEGTVNQIAVSNKDGDAGDPTVSFDTYRVLSTQPCFLATVGTTISDVTGNSTAYTVLFDTVVFDQGPNYTAGTGLFTAPVTGKYFFYSCLALQDIGAAHTLNYLTFATSATGAYIVRSGKLSTIVGADGLISVQGRITVNMSSGNTCKIAITVGGGTKIVDVYGDGKSSYFCGYLCL